MTNATRVWTSLGGEHPEKHGERQIAKELVKIFLTNPDAIIVIAGDTGSGREWGLLEEELDNVDYFVWNPPGHMGTVRVDGSPTPCMLFLNSNSARDLGGLSEVDAAWLIGDVYSAFEDRLIGMLVGPLFKTPTFNPEDLR